MMEAARTSETSVDNYFTRQYIPEDNSEKFFYLVSLRSLSLLPFHLRLGISSGILASSFPAVVEGVPSSKKNDN
jgi:hypothetical protein